MPQLGFYLVRDSHGFCDFLAEKLAVPLAQTLD